MAGHDSAAEEAGQEVAVHDVLVLTHQDATTFLRENTIRFIWIIMHLSMIMYCTYSSDHSHTIKVLIMQSFGQVLLVLRCKMR